MARVDVERGAAGAGVRSVASAVGGGVGVVAAVSAGEEGGETAAATAAAVVGGVVLAMVVLFGLVAGEAGAACYACVAAVVVVLVVVAVVQAVIGARSGVVVDGAVVAVVAKDAKDAVSRAMTWIVVLVIPVVLFGFVPCACDCSITTIMVIVVVCAVHTRSIVVVLISEDAMSHVLASDGTLTIAMVLVCFVAGTYDNCITAVVMGVMASAIIKGTVVRHAATVVAAESVLVAWGVVVLAQCPGIVIAVECALMS